MSEEVCGTSFYIDQINFEFLVFYSDLVTDSA